MPRSHGRRGEVELLDRIREPVRQFLSRVLDQPADVEDTTSQTFLKVIERYRAGVRPRYPVAYAIRVAWTRALDLRRKRAPVHIGDDAERVRDPRDESQLAELREWIQQGFRALAPRDRAILHLRHVEDLSYKEIAAALEVPMGTVKRRLHEARLAFRDALSSREGVRAPSYVLAVLPALAGKPASASTAFLMASLAAGKEPSVWAWWTAAWTTGRSAAVAAVLLLVAGVLFLRSWEWLNPGADTVALPARGGGGTVAEGGTTEAPGIASTPWSPEEEKAEDVRPVEGRVLDEGGGAVPGAHVIVYPDTQRTTVPASAASEVAGVAEGRSDDAGCFEIQPARPSFYYEVFAAAPGRAPGLVSYVRQGERVEIRLQREQVVTGQVKDLVGQPILGATVRWTAFRGMVRVEREATTGGEGIYRMTGTCRAPSRSEDAGERAFLRVSAKGFADRLVCGLPKADAGGVAHQDVYLEEAVHLMGTVRSAATGAPLAGAQVVLWRQGARLDLWCGDSVPWRHPFRPWVVGRTTTGPAGTYAFDAAPAGWGALDGTRRADPMAPDGQVGVLVAGHVVAIRSYRGEPGQHMVLDIDAGGSVALSGRVVDDTGSPAVDVEVRVVDVEPGIDCVPWSMPDCAPALVASTYTTRTGADGRYTFTAVPVTETPCHIRVAAVPPMWVGGMGSPEQSVELAGGEASLPLPDLVLPRLPAVDVHVVDCEGRPVLGADVSSGPELVAGQIASPMVLVRTGRDGWARLVFPLRGPEGTYQPGDPTYYTVKLPSAARRERAHVRALGYARALSGPFMPSVDAPPQVEVVLRKERVIRGRVLYDDGSPAAGTGLLVTDPEWNASADAKLWEAIDQEREEGRLLQYLWEWAGADGRFCLTLLPPGPCRIQPIVWFDRRQRAEYASIVVPPEQDEVLITLPPMPDEYEQGSIRLDVVDAESGRPVPDAVARVTDIPRFCSVKEEAPGRFIITGVPLHRLYTVEVTAPGWRREKRTDLEVRRDGETRHIEVRLERGGTVRGVVDPGGGGAFHWATLRWLHAAEGTVQEVPVQADGTFETRGLEPGADYFVSVEDRQVPHRPGRLHAPADPAAVHVPDERETTMRLVLAPAGEIDVELEGTSLFFRSYDRPASPEQRRLARHTTLRVTGDRNGFSWTRRPVQRKHHSFVLAPGRYRVRLEAGDVVSEERVLDLSPHERARVIFALPEHP